MNKEVKELLNKCDNCKLKECIGCEFIYVDIQKIKKYVGNIEILNETYQVINELSEREIKKLEQKESILDKVVDKIKEDIKEITLPCIIVGGRRNSKTLEYGKKIGRIETLKEILNIIEGETNNGK